MCVNKQRYTHQQLGFWNINVEIRKAHLVELWADSLSVWLQPCKYQMSKGNNCTELREKNPHAVETYLGLGSLELGKKHQTSKEHYTTGWAFLLGNLPLLILLIDITLEFENVIQPGEKLDFPLLVTRTGRPARLCETKNGTWKWWTEFPGL